MPFFFLFDYELALKKKKRLTYVKGIEAKMSLLFAVSMPMNPQEFGLLNQATGRKWIFIPVLQHGFQNPK